MGQIQCVSLFFLGSNTRKSVDKKIAGDSVSKKLAFLGE
jgi:hypothetical protein